MFRGLDEGKFESRKNGDQCEKAADDKMIIASELMLHLLYVDN